MDVKDVAASLSPFFKSYGFKRKGCRFYKIENQIAFAVNLGSPRNLNPIYYLWPLYCPRHYEVAECGFVINRLVPEKVAFHLGIFPEEEQYARLTESIPVFKKVCEEYIFPQFEKVGSPEKLNFFLDKSININKELHWRCQDWNKYVLGAYTSFYLSDFNKMAESIRMLEYTFANISYISNIIKKQTTEEIQRLTELSKAPEEERRRFIAECIDFTAEHCFKGIKREPYLT